MVNFFRGGFPAAAGRGAVAAALVASIGYGVGLTQSPDAVVLAQSAPVAQMAPGTTSYAKVVDAVTPAVVTVRVEKRAAMVPTGMPELPDDFFGQFFGRVPQQGQRQAPRQQRMPRQSGRHHHAGRLHPDQQPRDRRR
jgi:serine protease Do